MTTHTIKKLNQLNSDFYQTTAIDFSQSRQHAWEGWHQLASLLPHDMTVLDVGCGNGRFAQFLQTTGKTFAYMGIDSDEQLLADAQESCAEKNIPATFLRSDIVEALLSDAPIINQQFSVITLFGVLHHIPSFELRKKLLSALSNALLPAGQLIFTTWQFDKTPHLFEKRVSPAAVGIDENEVEENDFFLTWERGEPAIRYCHLTTHQEVEHLMKRTGLPQQTAFFADGKSHNLNEYFVYQKNR